MGTLTQPDQAGMTATPWISSNAFGLARCEMAIEALAGKSLPKISRRIAVMRGWLRGSVMNTVMVTMSESLPPASSSVAPRFANTWRTWASKSPASDLPEESTAPVCRTDTCEEPARGVLLRFSRAGKVAAEVRTTTTGRYSVRLRAGSYGVKAPERRIGTGLTPRVVRVTRGQMTRVDFHLDTGLQ